MTTPVRGSGGNPTTMGGGRVRAATGEAAARARTTARAAMRRLGLMRGLSDARQRRAIPRLSVIGRTTDRSRAHRTAPQQPPDWTNVRGPDRRGARRYSGRHHRVEFRPAGTHSGGRSEAFMLRRLRTTSLAGSSALVLVLIVSGVVAAATLLTAVAAPTDPTPDAEVVDTTATFEDVDGDGIDDDCDDAVTADEAAA